MYQTSHSITDLVRDRIFDAMANLAIHSGKELKTVADECNFYKYSVVVEEGSFELRGSNQELTLVFKQSGIKPKLRRILTGAEGDLVFKAHDRDEDILETDVKVLTKELLTDLLKGTGVVGQFRGVEEICMTLSRRNAS